MVKSDTVAETFVQDVKKTTWRPLIRHIKVASEIADWIKIL